jgi:TM2 domain-containing membrane protein YozV/RNA polymerase subunit RPABC4/transcription elongation factor Spt4
MALISCKECGMQISDSATVCPHCGAPVIKDVYCSKCGTKVPENIGTCPNCGNKIVTEQTQDNHLQQDRIVTGVLAILLGGLGIQYFYLGKISAGILSILITICTCGGWEIIAIIQGIIMLTMSDQDFVTRYKDPSKSFPVF